MEVGGEINYQVIYRADNQNQDLETINVKAPWSVSCNYRSGRKMYIHAGQKQRRTHGCGNCERSQIKR